MNSIIVTGGAGYIGSHICKILKNANYLPVTLDNLSNGHAGLVKWGPLEKGDLTNNNFVCQVIKKYRPAAVIHCAGYISVNESVSNPALYYKNNLIASISLLDAMIKENVKHLVFSSTCAVHGNPKKNPINENDECKPITPYGKSKHMVEQIIADYANAYDITYAMLRYFNASGADIENETGEMHNPETHLIPLALEAAHKATSFTLFGSDYATSDGTAVRDYIHVSDLAQAHLLAVEYLREGKKSEIINIGTGKGTSVKTLLEAVIRITQKKLNIVESQRRKGDPAELVADIAKAKNLLGFNPKFSDIESIIKTAWDWYQSINHHHE